MCRNVAERKVNCCRNGTLGTFKICFTFVTGAVTYSRELALKYIRFYGVGRDK